MAGEPGASSDYSQFSSTKDSVEAPRNYSMERFLSSGYVV